MSERRGSRAFWLLNLANFGDGIAYFGILNLLAPYLSQDVGMGDRAAGLSVSFFTASVTIFMLIGGSFCDRIGARRAINLAQGLQFLGRTLLALAVFAPAGRPLVAVLGLALMAAGSGTLQPALYAGVKDYTDPSKAAMGYSWLYAIMNLGSVAESLLSPYVRTPNHFIGSINGLGLGIQGVFLVMAAITLALWLTNLVFFSARVEATEKVLHVREGDAPPKPSNWRNLPIFDPKFAFFIFILLPVRTLFAHQFLTIPDYVLRCFPLDVKSKLEWIQSINPLIVAFCVPLATTLTRNVPVLRMMIVGTALSALSTFVLASPPELNHLLVYTALFSLGESLWSSRFLEYVAQLAPPGQIGAYMGVANLPWFLAKFTTGLYSGSMLHHFVPAQGPQDPGTLWAIYACIALISPIGLILGGRWIMASGNRVREGLKSVEIGQGGNDL